MITVLGGKRVLPPSTVSSSPFPTGGFQDSAQLSMLEASTQTMWSHLQVAMEAQGCGKLICPRAPSCAPPPCPSCSPLPYSLTFCPQWNGGTRNILRTTSLESRTNSTDEFPSSRANCDMVLVWSIRQAKSIPSCWCWVSASELLSSEHVSFPTNYPYLSGAH